MQGVQASAELERIKAIPRRRWTPDQAQSLVRALSAALKTPEGTQELLPDQAIALAEIGQWGGLLGALPVGAGKTLISGLAARVIPGVERPLILVPAHLRKKTRDELLEYRKNWVLPPFLRVESYQTLSRVGAATFLRDFAPDVLIVDEGSHLANPDAAVTRRVEEYILHTIAARKRVPYIDLDGTITGGKIGQICHRSSWALPRTNPCPQVWSVIDEWSRALDADVPEHRELAPGALVALCSPGETPAEAFGRRLADTPGVVVSEAPQLPIPIKITSHRIDLPPDLLAHFTRLRAKWNTPDDYLIEDGVAMWRHARELATGFYSVWDPRPPDDWKDARKAWNRECRDVLGSNQRALYSELQLIQFLQSFKHARDVRCPECGAEKGVPCAGHTCPPRTHYPAPARVLQAWEQIKPTFTPNAVARWVSDSTIQWIVRWARERPGLIWTDRPAVGLRLAELGIPYYGEDGIDLRTGRNVEAHRSAEGSIAVSIGANSTGRNLQGQWARNLIVDVLSSGRKSEQLIGRTHRRGQAAPLIEIDLMFGCVEDVIAFWKAHDRARKMRELTTQPQKLLHADTSQVAQVDDVDGVWPGPQWKKSKPPLTEG